MKTTDWQFDFSALPFWGDRSQPSWVYDEFFEFPKLDMLCCLYNIREVTMMNYLAHLAILRNKESPELVLNIAEGFSFRPECVASKDGTLLFLYPVISRNNNTRSPQLILDFRKNRFCITRKDSRFPLWLQKWYPIDQLSTLPDLI